MQTYRVPQSRCRFGIATADMTPPVGIYHRMWGAARHDRATGVHRPLVMTAAVFQAFDAEASPSAVQEQILLSLDHCILGNAELERIEQAILAESRLEGAQLAIVCSHTHGAGLL
ncbi:MAG TPA: hypothetical protein VHB77_15540, partial [Planctomycetaceae bacterium]|nr:hypothetical protein [Planctomycetaceae bacterium]